MGIVRVKSVATREAKQFSAAACLRRERSPLGQRRRAPLLVIGAAKEVAFQIKVIVHLSVNRHELLQHGTTPKSLHRMLAPPKRLM